MIFLVRTMFLLANLFSVGSLADVAFGSHVPYICFIADSVCEGKDVGMPCLISEDVRPGGVSTDAYGFCAKQGSAMHCLSKCIEGASSGDACGYKSTCVLLSETQRELVCSWESICNTSGCNVLGARSSVWVSLGSLLLGLFLMRRLSRA